MSQIRWILLTLVVMLFSGCTSSNPEGADNNMSSRNIATYQILKTGSYPHDDGRYLDAAKAFLVYYSDRAEDVAAFAKEYRLLTGEEAPAFDGTVIIARMGTQGTGGYSYTLHKVIEHTTYTEVQIENRKPAPEDMVTMALTNPYIVILLPENHKEVRIKEVE